MSCQMDVPWLEPAAVETTWRPALPECFTEALTVEPDRFAETVQGPVKFDSTGQNLDAYAYVFQWQNGQLLPYKPQSGGVLAPVLSGQGPVLFPKPAW